MRARFPWFFLIQMKKENWALILAAALAACGKNEPPAAPPELAAPGRAFSPAGTGSPEPAVAEAEVKASSGPVELTLRLHRTRIKLGESLWHQLRIRNAGDKEMLVTDQIFHDPWELLNNIWGGYGIFIEVIGPDGKPLEPPVRRDGAGDGIEPMPSGLLEIEGPQEQAMVDGWEKQGLSSFEVKLKLIEYNTKKERGKKPYPSRPVIHLRPGEIAETKSWFHYSRYDEKIAKRPAPQPIGEFAELEFFDLDEPGKYKIRAVYNHGISETDIKEYRKMGWSYDERVLFYTPWVRVTVNP